MTIYFPIETRPLVEKALETVKEMVLSHYKCDVKFNVTEDGDVVSLYIEHNFDEGDGLATCSVTHDITNVVQAYILGFIMATKPELKEKL